MAKYSTPAGRRFSFVSICIITLMLSGCDDSMISSPAEQAIGKSSSLIGTWNGPFAVSNASSSASPSIQVFNGKLHLFVTGESDTDVHHFSMNTSNSFTNHGEVNGVTTLSKPALTVIGSNLYLGFKGDDSNPSGYKIYYKYLNTSGVWTPSGTPDPIEYGGYYLFTSAAPELGELELGNGLTVFYNDYPNNDEWNEFNLNSSPVQLSPYTRSLRTIAHVDDDSCIGYWLFAKAYTSNKILEKSCGASSWTDVPSFSSSHSPAVTYDGGTLYLVGKGDSSNNLYLKTKSGGTWQPTESGIPGSTSDAPAVAVFNDRLYVFMKGASSGQIYYSYADL
jgi:hypothetical protein